MYPDKCKYTSFKSEHKEVTHCPEIQLKVCRQAMDSNIWGLVQQGIAYMVLQDPCLKGYGSRRQKLRDPAVEPSHLRHPLHYNFLRLSGVAL